jgi:hypothetical protein
MVEGSGKLKNLLSSGFQLIAQSKFQVICSFYSIAANIGVVAQLVEHLLCKQDVASSSLAGSTNFGRP